MTHLSTDKQTHAVDPVRLAAGSWCHCTKKTVVQGDTHASYSAERIGLGQPVHYTATLHALVRTGLGLGDRLITPQPDAY